ncbi:MAG: hypothetical protein JWP81_1075 [Ferruginibacter sp.]|nr:hypothetical protein [Ferruginibacter sp.]
MKKQVLITDIISAIILLLMLYAALSKLLQYQQFRATLSAAPVLKSFAALLAWLIPVTEIITAILLFFPSTRLRGLQAGFLLVSTFTVYLSVMVLATRELPCNCGGIISGMSWPQHIVFNIFFTILTGSGILVYEKRTETMKRTPP